MGKKLAKFIENFNNLEQNKKNSPFDRKLSDAAAVSYPKGYAVIEAEQINYKNDGINFPNYSFWKQLFT